MSRYPEQEIQDRRDAQLAMKTVKERAFELLRHLVWDETSIPHSGYKDLADATRKIIKQCDRDCNKIMEAHERKYP
jgi:hypothetical protein